MQIITNGTIRIELTGKSQREVIRQIDATGAHISNGSLRNLLSGKRAEVNGFRLETQDVVLVKEEPEVLVLEEEVIAPEVIEQEPEAVVPEASAVLAPGETFTISMANPFAGMFPGVASETVKRILNQSKTDSGDKKVTKPRSVENERLIVAFRKQFPQLVTLVESIEGTVLMRAAQGRILLLKNTRCPADMYWHLNILRAGYTLTTYVKGKSVKGQHAKEYSASDIVAAYADFVTKSEVAVAA